jgi:hypothetical protein
VIGCPSPPPPPPSPRAPPTGGIRLLFLSPLQINTNSFPAVWYRRNGGKSPNQNVRAPQRARGNVRAHRQPELAAVCGVPCADPRASPDHPTWRMVPPGTHHGQGGDKSALSAARCPHQIAWPNQKTTAPRSTKAAVGLWSACDQPVRACIMARGMTAGPCGRTAAATPPSPPPRLVGGFVFLFVCRYNQNTNC